MKLHSLITLLVLSIWPSVISAALSRRLTSTNLLGKVNGVTNLGGRLNLLPKAREFHHSNSNAKNHFQSCASFLASLSEIQQLYAINPVNHRQAALILSSAALRLKVGHLPRLLMQASKNPKMKQFPDFHEQLKSIKTLYTEFHAKPTEEDSAILSMYNYRFEFLKPLSSPFANFYIGFTPQDYENKTFSRDRAIIVRITKGQVNTSYNYMTELLDLFPKLYSNTNTPLNEIVNIIKSDYQDHLAGRLPSYYSHSDSKAETESQVKNSQNYQDYDLYFNEPGIPILTLTMNDYLSKIGIQSFDEFDNLLKNWDTNL